MAPLTPAQRKAAAAKAAATRKRNAAAAAKKGKAPSKSTFWASVKTTGQKFLAWLGKNWIRLLILIALVWLFFAFALPWLSILQQRNNAAIANDQGQAPAVSVPASTAPTTSGNNVSESTVLDLGSIGAYHAVYDSNLSLWTLGIWETSALPDRSGTGLSEFKLKATSVSFTMPADGEINNSAGHIAINNTEWTLGNPAKDASGNTLVKKGDTVTIWTDGPNDSAGFQIWFK